MRKPYKLYRYLLYKILSLLHHIRTWIIFRCNCDEFHDFDTAGVPFVNVSDKKGGSIKFGRHLRLNNGMSRNQIGFNCPCIFQAAGGSINIADNVGISQCTMVAVKGTEINVGEFTLIGSGVKLYTTDSHSLDYRIRRNPAKDDASLTGKSIIIGKDCFIGAGSMILKGVSIGDRAIIGAGSVVTKDIPSDCIAAGNPCKVIKSLLNV